MTRRRSWTPKRRAALFDANKGVCHICGAKIDGAREAWDVEHIIPVALGGDDDESNCAPAHKRCHKIKTAKDAANLAKSNRVRAKHFGAHKPRSILPGSRASGLKKKLDGTVVKR